MGEHVTISTPGKPTILKHKLNSHSKVNGKRLKKTPVVKGFNGTSFSSVRARHLKKDDGQPFWRKDIQYEFLTALFDNDTKAFTDPYPDFTENVHIEGRKIDPNGKLSFAEVYIKTIAQSSKCSKVLRDRLLRDMKMSIPTCMICLLVNVGRMNTTINFVPDMKSQLRTYHSIPSLQVNYDTGPTIDKNDKQLQDTPRLKSILKACCDDTNEPNDIKSMMKSTADPKTNIVNAIFVLCGHEDVVNSQVLYDANYHFSELFMASDYPPDQRAHLFLWTLYTYLESNLEEESLAHNPFGQKPTLVAGNAADHDIDTQEELEFGQALLEQRTKFLTNDEPITSPKKNESKSTPAKGKSNNHKSSQTSTSTSTSSGSSDTTSTTAETSTNNTSTTASSTPTVERVSKANTRSKTLAKQEAAAANNGKISSVKEILRKPSVHTPRKTANSKNATPKHPPDRHVNNTPVATPVPPPPPVPVLRQDIDVIKIRRLLGSLKKRNYRRRTRRGQLVHEYRIIKKENMPDSERDGNNRLRLKNYRGDFVEYTTKFRTLFNYLKSDYAELSKDVMEEQKTEVVSDYENPAVSLKLKEFRLNF